MLNIIPVEDFQRCYQKWEHLIHQCVAAQGNYFKGITLILLNIEETMSIIHLENNHRKINTLEEIEILKVASYKHLLNDVIAGQNDPIYELLSSSVI